MASFSDRATGLLFLLIAAVVFGYYTFWTMVLPFLPADHPAQAAFPPKEFAILIPVALLIVGISGVGAFLASVMLKQAKKKKAS
jgi:dolichyl-phosphate mannosyltransferase polypeptide 2 regulatory subunit